MFNGLYFEFPYVALFLLAFIVCDKFCKMQTPSIYFPNAQKFMNYSIANSKIVTVVKWMAIFLMVLAFMSPVKDETYNLEPKNGHEIAMILDASQSMQARGFDNSNLRLTRFDVVKNIVSDFITMRKNDNIGLVVFGEYSFIASPMTYDEHILNRIVSQLQIGMAGKYTALYESLAQGVNLLKMTKSKSKVAILLTDGYSTAGVDKIPLEIALDMAKKEGIKVYPIGIGPSSGRDSYNKQVLIKIAKETGGVAFGASNARELKSIYEKIDALEKSEIKNESYTYLKYYYNYPLFLALLFLLLFVYFKNQRGAA